MMLNLRRTSRIRSETSPAPGPRDLVRRAKPGWPARAAHLTAALGILLAFAGCYTIRGVPVGSRQAGRARDCAVELSEARPQELAVSHEQVGAVCLSEPYKGPTGFPTEAAELAELRAAACELGGELLAAQATCQNRQENGVEFGVWRKKKSP